MTGILASLRRFAHAQHGVAVVEFALIVPVMLTLYLGSIEASSLYTVDRRVTTVSSTLGDLVSQANGVLAQSELDNYFDAAKGILTPYATGDLHQVVSLISVDSSGATSVVWSRTDGGTERATGASYPLAADTQMNKMARGGYLVVSEASYAYTPVMGMVIKGPINLYRESFYLPRFAECIAVPGSSCPQ